MTITKASSILSLFVIIGILAFSIVLLNNIQETQIQDFDQEKISDLLIEDEYIESYIKTSIENIIVYSIYNELKNGVGVEYWDTYPRQCGRGPPTIEEFKTNIENEISSNIIDFIDYNKYIAGFGILGPYSLIIDTENKLLSRVILENNRGDISIEYDEYVVVNIEGIKTEFSSPYGSLYKNYEILYNISPNRAIYIYRIPKEWIENGGFQRIIDSYRNKIFVCSKWSAVNADPCRLCKQKNNENKGKCTTTTATVEGVWRICRDCLGNIVSRKCIPSSYVCQSTPIDKDIYYRESREIFGFIAGGSGGDSENGEGGGGVSGCPITCYYEGSCTTTITCNPPEECSGGVGCPSGLLCYPKITESSLRDMLENEIIPEIISDLEKAYYKDDYVKCKGEIEDVRVEYYREATGTRNNPCACGISGKTDTWIKAIIKVECIDKKYYYFFPDGSRDYNRLVFKLKIEGYAYCPPPAPPPIPGCCECKTKYYLDCDGDGEPDKTVIEGSSSIGEDCSVVDSEIICDPDCPKAIGGSYCNNRIQSTILCSLQ